MKEKALLCLLTIALLTALAVGIKTKLSVPNTVDTTRTLVQTTDQTTPKVEETTEKTTASTTEKTTQETTTSTTTKTTTGTTVQTTTETTVITTAKAKTTRATTAIPTTTTTKADESLELVTGFEQEMLKLVNAERKANGVKPLSLDTKLCGLAQIRAKEIAKNYRSDHTRLDGSEWSTVLNSLSSTSLGNWTSAGENIAYGQLSTEEIMEDWLASPGHRQNIIKEEYTHAGFACCSNEGILYWEQIFVG